VSRARLAAFLLAFLLACLAAVGTARPGASEVVYVLDVSRSHGPAPDLLLNRAEAWHAHGHLRDRKARVILAGATALPAGSGLPPGLAEGSRVDLGLELARRTLGAADRVVVLSDGRFDHAAILEPVRALAAAGATVQFGGPLAEPALDFRLVPLRDAPVQGGEARVEVGVAGTNREAREVTLVVGGGATALRSKVVVSPGAVEKCELLVPVAPGTSRLTVAIEASDAAASNDELSIALRRDERRALVVGEGAQSQAIIDVLRASGAECDVWTSLQTVDIGHLGGADLIVLVDLPIVEGRHVIPLIEETVTVAGAGLWVVGGPRAFGAGGYAGTRLDDLLPLSSRPFRQRDVSVLLDTSGSMEKDDRLRRAVDAIVRLADGLDPRDRVQVLPFAAAPGQAVPAEPASPEVFLLSAVPALRRIAAHGGTRLLPVIDAALARAAASDRESVFALVTDARDDEVKDDELAARGRALRDRKAAVIVLLLDPAPETEARVRLLLPNTVVSIPADGWTPRVLLDALELGSWERGPFESVRPGGGAGPHLAWKNRVREGREALVALRTAPGEPVMATAFRGAGRTAAWAAWPVEAADAAALTKEWAERVARPVGWKRISARREDGRVLVSMPPAAVPEAPLALADGGGVLRERTPGVFEVPDPGPASGSLKILQGTQIFGTVALPAAGDPEYAFPAGLPAAAPDDEAPSRARLRAPWAALSAAAWAAGLLLRRRGA
jgi:von Willebrand factor type A domain